MKKILLLILFVVLSCSGFAATYYSRVATGNFATVGTWSVDRSGTPTNATALTAADIFIIQTGNNITLGASQIAASVTIESGGTLTPNNTRTLTAALTIDSGGTLNINTRQYTQTGALINNGAITGTTGQLIMGASSLTNAGSITLTTGRITRASGGNLTNSGSITLGAGQFTANSGTFTNEATGTVTITGTATVTLGTGNFTNNNTSASVNFGSSLITISGTANQSIGGFTTTGRFTASKTAGTTTITGDINSGGITKSGAGILNMGSGTHTTTNTVVLTAGTMNGETSTINVNFLGTTWTGTGTVFSAGTSTVNFGAAGAQTLSATGTKTFYNLNLSNSGLKTIASTTVTNILSMEGDATASVAPTYGANATLRYNTANPRTVGAEWLATFVATGGVIIDNSGAITTNGNKVFDLDVPLTIISGATISPAAGNTFSFGGDLINDGTWTASTGDVTITLARANQLIGSFSTSGLVTMSKASETATFTGNIDAGAFTMNGAGTLDLGTGLTHTFTGDWTNTDGTLQGNTSTLNIGGTGSVTGGTFTAGTGTVHFNGTGAQDIPAFTYYQLILSGSGAKTILTGTTVTVYTIEIQDGPTLDISGTALLNITKP